MYYAKPSLNSMLLLNIFNIKVNTVNKLTKATQLFIPNMLNQELVSNASSDNQYN